MTLFGRKTLPIWLSAGLLVIISLVIVGWIWSRVRSAEPREAPEGEVVLQAQADLPFQILIPAYLPAGFQRKNVEIQSDLSGPQGQVMAQLVYTHPLGVRLMLTEWMLSGSEAADMTDEQNNSASRCSCMCSGNQCSANRLMIDNGPLRITGETSDPLILSPQHVQVILTTLAPAGGLLTYSSIEDVPVPGLPPAEEVPVNADGVQEVILVVSSTGYTPIHFSVKKDVPVRLIFRQLGEVGCGNELYIEWGAQQPAHLVLSTPEDSQVLEFTPHESGDFLFRCPHDIYQGIMTVIE